MKEIRMPAWHGGFYTKQFKYVGGIKVDYWELWGKVENYESGELAEATWPCKDTTNIKNLMEQLQDV
jgi:hypothetical protein